MILEEVRIENLFSYYGEQVFDLRPPQDGTRNVALIHGRNGQGKTNFLKCIKLLFGGVTDELRSAEVGFTLQPNEYVLGSKSKPWDGILNRRARGEACAEGRYRVTAALVDGDRPIEIRRAWELRPNDREFDATVEVDVRGRTLREPEAVGRLIESLIAKEHIPYFFFDGELVQQLAVAESSARADAMERLLGLSRPRRLLDAVRQLRKEWRVESADAEERRELQRLGHERDDLRAKLEANRRKRRDLADELQESEERQASLANRLRQLSSGLAEHEWQRLDARREQMQETAQGARDILRLELPVAAPYLFGRRVVDEALVRLRALTAGNSKEVRDRIREAAAELEMLPPELFKPPPSNPALLAIQVDFYQRRLRNLIDTFRSRLDAFVDAEPTVPDIPPRRARIVRESLEDRRAHAHPRRFRGAAKELREARERIASLSASVEELGHVSEQDRRRLESMQLQSREVAEKIGAIKTELKKLEEEEEALRNEDQALEQSTRRQEKAIRQAEAARRRTETCRSLAGWLSGVHAAARASRREQMETFVNRHFSELFTASLQVARLRVAEDFSIEYRDRDARRIAPGNLSAGMKQLAAIAVLWSLVDAAESTVPVVIDTPLSRLDREHQDRIVKCYFPRASQQVLLLPTDAELTRERYERLLPYIYQEYELNNPEGDRTIIRGHSPMHPRRGP